MKLLFDSLPKHGKYTNKYKLIDISKYKYFDIKNIKNDYTINFNLSFEDTYLNKCKILIIMTKTNNYYLFITHTNITYILNNLNIITIVYYSIAYFQII